jgi:hypothetical protein
MTCTLVLHFAGEDDEVEVKITDDQFAALEAHAAVAQLPLDAFIRRLFEQQLQAEAANPDEDQG